MPINLCERLSFDTLFRASDPKRVYRSFGVKGPQLEIDSYQDAVYYSFNFKSNPSTTGLRHRGYIKFFKPKHKNPKEVPLQHLECLVDCMCPDYRYKWSWSNKQRGSSVVGPQSLNQAWNKAPRITNPENRIGLCKHLMAARKYIYGLMSSFSGNEPDTAEKLNQLTKIATKRWTDFDGAMQAAKEREAVLLKNRALRNVGAIKPQPLTPTKPVAPPAPAAPPGPKPGQKPGPKPSQPPKSAPPAAVEPEPLPEPLVISEPTLRQAKAAPGKGGKPTSPPASKTSTKPKTKPKRVIGNRFVSGMMPGPVPGTWESLQSFPGSHVVKATVQLNDMSTLKEAVKLVEEMETDELELRHPAPGTEDDFGGAELAGGLDDAATLDSPSEPPISDAAIGADTEGETALGLLRQMKDLLAELVSAVAPESAVPGEAGEGKPPGEGVPPEPPGNLPGEEAEFDTDLENEAPPAGEDDFEAGEEAGEDEEFAAERRPAPKKKGKPEADEDDE